MEIRDTLLVVCARSDFRGALSALFAGSYNLLEAENQRQAVPLMERNYACIAAVLVDIDGPDAANFQLLQKLRDHTVLSQLPAIVALHESARDAEEKLLALGAADVIAQDCAPGVLKRRVKNVVRLYRSQWQMQELVEEQARLLFNSNDAMVDALSSIIEYRSVETGQHIVRIRHFTQVLLEEVARSCPEYGLTRRKISLIASASALHDIGKISIPDSILNKPGRLSTEEWQVMETHPIVGCHILETLGDSVNAEYLHYAHNICHYHHEHWDGHGYPEGLAGDRIPICAQVVSLADVYDALTSRRIYKEAYDCERAVEIILGNQCGKFSPKLLECFERVRDEFAQLVVRYGDQQPLREESQDLERQQPVYEPGMDVLNKLQMKYQRLLHYINATIIELDLEKESFHMVYSPDPEIAALGANANFMDGVRSLLIQLTPQEEQRRIVQLFKRHIEQLFEKGLNRLSFRFDMRAMECEERQVYNVTLLRENMLEQESRNLLVIWQRMESVSEEQGVKPPVFLHDQLTGSYCCRNDGDLTLVQSNRLTEMLGYAPDEFEACLGGSLAAAIVPAERKQALSQLREQLAQGTEAEISCRMQHRNGRKRSMLTRCRMVVHEDGMEYLHGLMFDTGRSTHDDLKHNVELLHVILNQTDNVIFEWDVASDTISYSRHSQDLFGYEPLREQITAHLEESHIHPEDRPLVYQHLHLLEAGQEYHEMEVRIGRADGNYRWYRFRATAFFDENGRPERMVGIIINIDREWRATQALREQVELDALTQLLNKNAGRQRAEERLIKAAPDAHFALLIIDLDNFKQVNDRYGHMFGDAVLARMAAILRAHFASDELVARIGGDEFMALMCSDGTERAVRQRCMRLLSDLREGLGKLVYEGDALSCSIGVALAPEHARSYTALFQRADKALYRVKDAGKDGYHVHSVSDPESLRGRSRATTVSERIDSDERPGLADNGIVRYVLKRLYESGDAEATINEMLALVGQQMNVSRVYIFENSPDNRTCSNTFEWCNTGIASEKDNLQCVSYERELLGYPENFNAQGVFHCADVTKLPRPVYEIVSAQGIKSMLQCAILDKGVFRGYVGFDECAAERMWTEEQISVLTFFSEVVSVFLLKMRAQSETAHRVEDFTSVLDSQRNFIYVIDPHTCELRFANAAARRAAGDVRVGMRCYEALMGRTARCEDCPARYLTDEQSCVRRLENEQLGGQLRAEVSRISWRGREACLVVCTEAKTE